MGRQPTGRFASLCLASAVAVGGCYGGKQGTSAGDGDSAADGGTGSQTDTGDESGDTGVDPPPDEALNIPTTTAIPRLSRREIERTIVTVFGIEGVAEQFLPEDPRTAINPSTGAVDEAFDTFSATKDPSAVFVEGLESMAVEVGREFSANPTAVADIAGCTPSGAWDPDCLRSLIDRLGLQLWRRPLSSEETDALLAAATPFGEEAGHDVAVRSVVQSLLQSPAFIYQSEVGTDAGQGLRRLDNYELVSRLAFFLWGSGPTLELLDAASGADLDDEALAELARTAAADGRNDAQVLSFHQMWLRYNELLVSDTDLAADMRAESDALVDRALFDPDAEWSSLFTSSETFVTPELAEHYGLPTIPSEPSWVEYGSEGRAGLLSHGSFLSLSSTMGSETLMSRRGAMLGQRILCQGVPPPPPDVDIDDGVEVDENACKIEAYAAHSESGSACSGCHQVIDGIGSGFERFDGLGRYRDVEPGKPDCPISGEGTVAGQPFSGPQEFAAILDQEGAIAGCGVEQLSRFAFRGAERRDEFVERLTAAFEDSGQDFGELVVAVVTDPAFRYRREEEQ